MIFNTYFPLAPWGEDARRAGEGPLTILLKQRPKLCRDRSFKLHRLARNRMVETEHVGVKTKSVKRIITIAVFYISTHRMPHIRGMNTYLVLTTSLQTEFYERMLRCAL